MIIVASIVGVIGLMFLTNAVYFFLKDRRERAAWGSAAGVVVEHRERFAPHRRVQRPGTSAFSPVVKFTTETGAVVEFEDSLGERPARHAVGESVPVLYDRDAPQSARIERGTSGSEAVPFLFAGTIALLLSAGLVWFALTPAT